MRLLERDSNGRTSLRNFPHNNVPRYAILSHTWGADEVTFEDMKDGAENKLGFKKIMFCGEQAARDGLKHFWVDTCCIDRSSSAELQEAINSMFRWYSEAAVCYVYLADVSVSTAEDVLITSSWEAALRGSRWFTRGWTLQELLAPESVEFFTREGVCLGNKSSLKQYICEITGVPARVLQSSQDLSCFTVDERMAWMHGRDTMREEDLAYSLLGIFNVHMPLIYSEGKEKAFKRLREEISKDATGPVSNTFSIPSSFVNGLGVQEFVAREEELTAMHESLRGDGSRRAVVLHGLGGIGKTQLSLEYAKRHKRDYSAMFWMNAKDRISIQQSFVKVASHIQKHSSAWPNIQVTGNNIDQVVDAVKHWLNLADNTQWLIICDNYDNPKLPGQAGPAALNIYDFLPESDHGSLIITTRVSQVEVGRRIYIQKLDLYQGLRILSNTSRREGLENDPDAIDVARELDGHPLALATAGAYLEQVATSFKDYLRFYKQSWTKLQKMSPGLSTYDQTLYSTWQLSFEQVKRQNELSAYLLRWWAYFDNQDLWLNLLQHRNQDSPEWVRELTEDELVFDSAVRVLSSHGLVEAGVALPEQGESSGYSMHPCVHAWTVHVLNQEWDRELATLAVRCVASHIPTKDSNLWWLTQRRLLRHAARCLHMISSEITLEDGMEWELYKLGILYYNQGKRDEAENLLLRALERSEKNLGPAHMTTIDTVYRLGHVYFDKGKLNEAERMYEKALQGYDKAHGPDHFVTLKGAHSLGLLYAEQGKLAKAEQVLQGVLQRFENIVEPNHESTLDTVHNLGIVYYEQGKFDKAEQMYQRILKRYENSTGPDNPSVLETIGNLASLYSEQGKLDEAEQLYQRAIKGHKAALGPENASTLDMITNLGTLYFRRGDVDQAEQMYREALRGYEKAFGPDKLPKFDAVNNLGTVYCHMGKLDEAEQMFQRALQGNETRLGSDHFVTLDVVNNLGRLRFRIGRLDEAEKMYQQALHGYEKALGPEAVSQYRPALHAVENLGDLFFQQERLIQAREMYSRARDGHEDVLGPTCDEVYKFEGHLATIEKMLYTEGTGVTKKIRSSVRKLARGLFK